MLNAELRSRSKKLYEKKMRDEIKPTEVLHCFVHGDKESTFLQMSK